MWRDFLIVLGIILLGFAVFYRDKIKAWWRPPLPIRPGLIHPQVERVAENYAGVPILAINPKTALDLGPYDIQNLSYYLYLNGLSLVNRKVWLAEFLRLAKVPDGEGGQIVEGVTIDERAWQTLDILSSPRRGCGGVDFHGV